ncbi:MAG: hypothetical protein AAF226_19285, partial [Verrucomicrobiota bacterium]
MKPLYLHIRKTVFAALIAASGVMSFSVHAEISQDAIADDLRHDPPRQYDFNRAVLSDTMRLVAADAGINFFGLPEGTPGADKVVTFSIKASPFRALETLAKAHGVDLIYQSGIWYLKPKSSAELIGKVYKINHNSQEMIRKNSQQGISQSSVGSNSAGSGLNLQGAPDFFVVEPSRLLEGVRNILDLNSGGGVAGVAVPQVSFGASGGITSIGGQQNGGLSNSLFPQPTSLGSQNQAKVIWNSDSNSLYVVATEQQHEWVRAYLAEADRPQPMIAVEVKFLETSRDPRTDLGID